MAPPSQEGRTERLRNFSLPRKRGGVVGQTKDSVVGTWPTAPSAPLGTFEHFLTGADPPRLARRGKFSSPKHLLN